MSLADLQVVVGRLQSDGAFYRLVLEWPDELCRQYALSSDEIEALQAGDADALVRFGVDERAAQAAARAIKPPRPSWTSSLYSRAAQFHQRP